MQETSQKERVKKFGEVFTPEWMVRKMCDELEENSPGAFDIDSTFLEPTCGDGVFVEEILRRIENNLDPRMARIENKKVIENCRKDSTQSLFFLWDKAGV